MEDMNLLSLSDADIKSLKETFYQEAVELIESLVHESLLLEDSKDRDPRLKVIKRVFHTLKGDAASIGLKDIAGIAHRTEDILCAVENKSIEINGDLINILLKIADCIKERIEINSDSYEEGKDIQAVSYIMEHINKFLNISDAKQPIKSEAYQFLNSISEYDRLLIAEHRSQGKGIYLIKFLFSKDCQMRSAGAIILAQHLPASGNIVKTFPPLDSSEIDKSDSIDIIIASNLDKERIKKTCNIPWVTGDITIEELEDEWFQIDLVKSDNVLKTDLKSVASEAAKETDISKTSTIRVESKRIDQLMDLVGELVIGRSMLTQLFLEFAERFPKEELLDRFAYTNSFIERNLSDLQRGVMKVRMVPIDKVFKRFPRVVRDIAQASNKDIKLVIHGKDTEVDKGLVDIISESLIHIVRNAIDHGIETIEDREASGKERQGTIMLNAYHQGNDIIVEVKDDGRGIDPKRLKERAIEKGILDKNELEKMDDNAVINLIFIPGFSTTNVVSELSGRGVGLDVVKTAVESLRGDIHVNSEVDRGTAFILRFPITLAIIKAILFNVGDKLFAIPLGLVKEITRAFIKDVEFVSGKEVLRIRDSVIPLIRIEDVLKVNNVINRTRDKLFIIVVNTGGKDIGIVVNKLAGEEELVMKSINDQWINTNIIGGASVLGDGKVVLILNVAALIKKANKSGL